MDHGSSPPIREYSPQKTDGEELTPVMQSQEHQVDCESSSDDVPLRQQRPLREPNRERENSHDLHDRRQLRDPMCDINDTSLLDQRRAAHQATLLKPPKAAAKSSGKAPKKPGPRPWASKPIMKNDMVAKMEVIREIEKYWGKGFIKAYIPKCHRPLVKRGKGGKRAMYRDHETDPKKWLPSVLKAILMIAKLTRNKAWLKKAMNDVVRYRIKNTGNRKPQLVTTDFDVLEDMLVKDWDVSYSFGIRYKHLLVNRQSQHDTDEDIDHILEAESGEEDGSDDEDDVEGGNINDQDDEHVDGEDDSDEEMGQGGLTGQYLHTSGYTNAPQYPNPMLSSPPKQHKVKQEKSSKGACELPLRPQPPSRNEKSQQGYSQPYPYGPPVDRWGRPMPYGSGPDGYGGYDGYRMYGGYGGYVPPPDSDGRYPSQPQGFNSMGQYPRPHHAMTPAHSQPDTDRTDRTDRRPTQDSPFGGNKRMHAGFEQPPFSVCRPGFQPHGYTQNFQMAQTEVKQESPEFEIRSDGCEMSVDEVEGPTNDLGEDSNAVALEAELRATELELKVARLQAKRAALNQQSRAK
ncbi:hypothetical protein BU25DRAFT_476108 [Macroventuria anomochaeta]|uniref:Uncharacterized protein n=1 Tax=Macroventuria anomochaeta TaxID=301207 RepID=A0ACB6RT66_9PLEO|nr:uncharacterized protein BU25DRAFT_476108 [Macroventuria anomochaeta]KAF2624477.1 hypothetical protein BU25DRAFT_476108 [Macroventuria anomochaeta]